MRTQEQYLEKLKSMRHNIYLDGECIGRDDPRIVKASSAIRMTFSLVDNPEMHDLMTATSHITGKTINRSLECLQYYSGRLVGIAAIFSAIQESHGLPVHAIFGEKDIPGYQTSISHECPQCGAKQKIDAIVNSFGYSKV